MTRRRRTRPASPAPARGDAAVALEYSGDGAPRITATGRGEVAERILATAREHNVPIHEDAELTGLLARLELGAEVPPTLYVAVAEVLAFAYWLSGKAPPEPGGGDG